MDRVEYQSLIIQDLVNLEEADELNTNPWYQRRSVWNNSQKSYLVNSIFEKKPVPSIYIRHSLDLEKGKSIKEVVDGQQRVRAVIGYSRNEFTAKHPMHIKLVKFSDLTPSQKKDFLMTSLPVGYLLGSSDADVIDIFARINSVAKTLNSQEKRNALFSGEFKQFCTREAVIRTEFWKTYEIFSPNDIARMNEVQFISDLVMNMIEGISDFSQPRLNAYYRKYDDHFAGQIKLRKRLESIFDKISALNPSVIKETIFNRQPLFFSLLLIIDSHLSIKNKSLQEGLQEIDSRFNSDKPLTERSKDDVAFYNACVASTQRINNRKIRHKYIEKFL